MEATLRGLKQQRTRRMTAARKAKANGIAWMVRDMVESARGFNRQIVRRKAAQ